MIFSIAIQIKNKNHSVTIMSAFLSFIIGVSVGSLCGIYIDEHFSNGVSIILISTVAILGDKIGNQLVYKFNIDIIFEAIVEAIKNKIKKL